MSAYAVIVLADRSAPVWGRELKFLACMISGLLNTSAPVWGRELKYEVLYSIIQRSQSAPVWGRELKYCDLVVRKHCAEVGPRVGPRVEISLQKKAITITMVGPRVGPRVEIQRKWTVRNQRYRSAPVWGRELK